MLRRVPANMLRSTRKPFGEPGISSNTTQGPFSSRRIASAASPISSCQVAPLTLRTSPSRSAAESHSRRSSYSIAALMLLCCCIGSSGGLSEWLPRPACQRWRRRRPHGLASGPVARHRLLAARRSRCCRHRARWRTASGNVFENADNAARHENDAEDQEDSVDRVGGADEIGGEGHSQPFVQRNCEQRTNDRSEHGVHSANNRCKHDL